MAETVKIRKGLNIKLKGKAEKVYVDVPISETVAVKPTDFTNLRVKLLCQVGDEVKAGTALFCDKDNDKVVFTSPVSGEVVEVKRGDKRRILEIKVLADKEVIYEPFKQANPADLSREEIIKWMLKSGTWPLIRQRPFEIIANPEDIPKAIFISAFNSAPLAPDNDFILHGHGEEFQAGLDAVGKLSGGKVHLNINASATASKVFTNSTGVQINKISGPHPAGNVGVQIHHIDAVNKGEVVWHLSPQDVLMVGRLFIGGKYDASRVVALTGSEVKKTRYHKTIIGTSIKNMIADNIVGDNVRYISGNVLTGTQIDADGYLGFYDAQVTVIPEGNESRFLGWLAPGFDKFSLSRTFFSWLTPGKEYALNSNMNGESRAYVVTGQYEQVLPMDIYPVQMLKSIMIGDVEQLENLGIYEVAEEDFALCEYVCTSKVEVQDLIRQGLDMVKKEC
ncbi:MAG TPA: Na(+)-translocating NADH-quinone reductase subunit A [Flavobacteriales bacterium]|nr:Na(+)-translocating NADH-quinone reductase subunit A [Flavobacteriales bacterium]HIO67558.1 Na(+)-translocating NADH-quinone reductase subunit A [Flavobacteriales bacterium]